MASLQRLEYSVSDPKPEPQRDSDVTADPERDVDGTVSDVTERDSDMTVDTEVPGPEGPDEAADIKVPGPEGPDEKDPWETASLADPGSGPVRFLSDDPQPIGGRSSSSTDCWL